MSIVQRDEVAHKRFLKKRANSQTVLWIIFILLCLAGMGNWVRYQVKKIEISQKKHFHKLAKVAPFFSQQLTDSAIPEKLIGVPFGEDLGIVLDVIKVNIRNVIAPYNPAIVKNSNGYDLFFRYDIFNPLLKYAPFSSNIGAVSLDRQFQQQGKEFKRLDLNTNYGEDPRVLSINDQLYLFYNRMEEDCPQCRFMCVANLERDTYKVNYNTTLDMNLQWIEKNWTPFEYIGPDQQSQLLIEYKINPRKLIELPNPQVNEIKNINIPASLAYLNLSWTFKWGEIRGGTPPVLIGDEYLGFFHSCFVDDYKYVWYVIGAYTFAANAPFQVTGISPYPILFKEIYDTPLINTASLNKRVVFPSGFVIEKNENGELIYLACGENDAGIKILVIDKENLIRNLVRF